MTEGIIVLSIFVGLILMTNQSGIWQDKSIQMLANTTHQAFVKSKGDSSMEWQYDSSIENRPLTAVRADAHLHHMSPERIRLISRELNFKDERIKLSQSASFSSINDRNKFKITRHSYVDIGSGYSHSDKNVHDRIKRSQYIWGQAYSVSLPVAKTIGAATSVVDRPWNRTPLQTDWFNKWQGAVPESKLKSFKP